MRFAKHEWWLPKIFCLIAACALWVYVMNEQNPMVENTYTVPVEVRNLDPRWWYSQQCILLRYHC